MKQVFSELYHLCRRRFWLALAAAGAVAPGLCAQTPSPLSPPVASGAALTLDRAIAIALANHPALNTAGHRADAARGRAEQSGLWRNPELSLRSEEWPVESSRGFADAKQTVGLAQEIPFPGKRKLERQTGVAGVRFSEQALALRELELTRDIKKAFYEVLAAERILGVASNLAAVAEMSASTARKRVSAGAAPDQEELRAAIVLEQARVETAKYRRDLAGARSNLAFLLGKPELAQTPLAGDLAETADPALVEGSPPVWLAKHPEAAAARASLQQAESEQRRARLEPYPDIKLEAAGGRLGDTGESIVELGISVPLPIIDRSKGRRREALANARAAASDVASVEQRLLRDWRAAADRLRAADEQAGISRERILPRAQEALRLVQTGFEGGKFGFIDLLDTQRTAAEARLAYQQQLLELNIARADLEFLSLHKIP